MILLAIMVFGVSSGFSQVAQDSVERKEIEQLFSKRSFNCDDIYENCGQLVTDYYERGKLDSVAYVVDYWQSQCYGAPALVRLQVLLALQSGFMPADLYASTLFRAIRYYKWYYRYGDEDSRKYRASHESAFDTLIDKLAASALEKTAPQSVEHQIVCAMTGAPDSLYHLLQRPGSTSGLSEAYRARADSVRYSSEEYFGLFSGTWMPQGERHILANQALVGVTTGFKWHRFIFEIMFYGAVGGQSKSYDVNVGGMLHPSTDFNLLVYAGDFGYEFWRNQHHEIDGLIGIGVQEAVLIFEGSKEYEDGKLAYAFHTSAGLGYRFYPFKYNSTFLFVQPRVELGKINTDGGSDLSGYALSIRIGICFRSFGKSKQKYPALRELEYEY